MHVAYLPSERIIGLSKIPRLVNLFARRFQVQERLTAEVADAVVKLLDPKGVIVIAEAQHLCMAMRGVEKQNSFAITSAMLGGFQNDARTRSEFLELLNRPALGQRATDHRSSTIGHRPSDAILD